MPRVGADSIGVCEVASIEALSAGWVREGRARGVRVAWTSGPDDRTRARIVSERRDGRVRLRTVVLEDGDGPLARRRDPWARALRVEVRGAGVQVLAPTAVDLPSENSRMRLLAPTACRIEGGWLAAWLREDTGRVSLEVGVSVRGVVERRRVAEVWTALDPRALAVAAPRIAPRRGGGVWLAWREERGPKAGVYLKALDASGRADGAEVRVSTRGLVAEAVAPALCVDPSGRWWCAFAERRAAGSTVCLAHG